MNDTPESEISALVTATIQSKVIQALRDAPRAIDELVQAALKKPVNEHGGNPRYSTEPGTMPYLEWLVGEAIRDAARKAVTEAVKERAPEIHAAVREAISADKMVDALSDAILGSIKEGYRIDIRFVDQQR